MRSSLGGMGERLTLRVASSVALSLFRALVLVVATMENPDSHRYVVVNGRRSFTALSARHGYSFETAIQKEPRSSLPHCNFKVLSVEISRSWDSRCEGKATSFAVGSTENGSKIHVSLSGILSKVFIKLLCQL